jgi:hypothetical protein
LHEAKWEAMEAAEIPAKDGVRLHEVLAIAKGR